MDYIRDFELNNTLSRLVFDKDVGSYKCLCIIQRDINIEKQNDENRQSKKHSTIWTYELTYIIHMYIYIIAYTWLSTQHRQ